MWSLLKQLGRLLKVRLVLVGWQLKVRQLSLKLAWRKLRLRLLQRKTRILKKRLDGRKDKFYA